MIPAPSSCGACSSTRSTRPPARSSASATSWSGPSSRGRCGWSGPRSRGRGARRRLGLQKLIEALDALKHARPEHTHEVVTDRLTISDAIARVADVPRLQRRATFEELLSGPIEQRHTRRRDRDLPHPRGDGEAEARPIFQASLDEAGSGAEILVEAKDTLGDDVPAPGGEDYR